MSEARQPLLPEGWQLIPGGIIEGLEAVTTKSEAEPNPTSSDETSKVVVELGKKAIRQPGSNTTSIEDPFQGEEILEPITLRRHNRIQKGSAEPNISGMRVIGSATPDQGKIRAANAIQSFLKIRGGRVAEDPLIERLMGAGFTRTRAGEYIEEACIEGKLVKVGTFYRSIGT